MKELCHMNNSITRCSTVLELLPKKLDSESDGECQDPYVSSEMNINRYFVIESDRNGKGKYDVLQIGC